MIKIIVNYSLINDSKYKTITIQITDTTDESIVINQAKTKISSIEGIPEDDINILGLMSI